MPVDLGAEYLSGMRTAAAIAAERQRLAAERERTEMEAQARTAVQQRLALETQTRLQTEKAYHDAELSIRQQRLQQAAAFNAQKVHQEALKMADQHGFAADLATGMSVRDALARHPYLSTPNAAVAAERLSPERLDLARRNVAAREREIGDREAAALARADTQKKKESGETPPVVTAIPAMPTDDLSNYHGPRVSLRANDPRINTLLPGTNSMFLGTNWPGNNVPVPPSTDGAASPDNLVRRKTKDGRTALFDANTKQFVKYADAD